MWAGQWSFFFSTSRLARLETLPSIQNLQRFVTTNKMLSCKNLIIFRLNMNFFLKSQIRKSTEMVFCYLNCSSDREKLLKFEAEARKFPKSLRSLQQSVQTVKGQNNFWYSCNNITMTSIQISRLFYFGFFSKTNHQMMI